jgi:hypothetical protein
MLILIILLILTNNTQQTNKQTNTQQTNKQTNKQTHKQTNKQTNTHSRLQYTEKRDSLKRIKARLDTIEDEITGKKTVLNLGLIGILAYNKWVLDIYEAHQGSP